MDLEGKQRGRFLCLSLSSNHFYLLPLHDVCLVCVERLGAAKSCCGCSGFVIVRGFDSSRFSADWVEQEHYLSLGNGLNNNCRNDSNIRLDKLRHENRPLCLVFPSTVGQHLIPDNGGEVPSRRTIVSVRRDHSVSRPNRLGPNDNHQLCLNPLTWYLNSD